jgi:hypothetical protein
VNSESKRLLVEEMDDLNAMALGSAKRNAAGDPAPAAVGRFSPFLLTIDYSLFTPATQAGDADALLRLSGHPG